MRHNFAKEGWSSAKQGHQAPASKACSNSRYPAELEMPKQQPR
jgi:hypothetical protein